MTWLEGRPICTVPIPKDGGVLAFDILGLVSLAQRSDCLIEMVPPARAQSRASSPPRLHAAPDDVTALAVVDDAVEEVMGGDVTAAAISAERKRLLELIRDMALRVRLSRPRLRRGCDVSRSAEA